MKSVDLKTPREVQGVGFNMDFIAIVNYNILKDLSSISLSNKNRPFRRVAPLLLTICFDVSYRFVGL